MRYELAEAVAQLFASKRPLARKINEHEINRIDHVISLVVRLRGAVERERNSREIEAVYGAEGPARIGLALERLLAGLDTLGVERSLAMDVIEAVAMDSVPPLRRRAYEHLCAASRRQAHMKPRKPPKSRRHLICQQTQCGRRWRTCRLISLSRVKNLAMATRTFGQLGHRRMCHDHRSQRFH